MLNSDDFSRAESAADFLLTQTSLRPRIGLVLGSGLGGFADELSEAARVPYASIPGFPQSTAVGHAGQVVIGLAGDVPVAVMQGAGRVVQGSAVHQGVSPRRV